MFCSNCSNQSFYRGSGSSGRSTEYGLIINNIVFQRDSTMNCGLWTVDVCNYIVLWNQEWQFLGLTSSSGPNLVLKPESRVQCLHSIARIRIESYIYNAIIMSCQCQVTVSV